MFPPFPAPPRLHRPPPPPLRYQMTEVLLKKEFGGLKPVDDNAYKVLEAIKTGATLMVNVKDQSRRSTQQHRFWFAMVGVLFDSQTAYDNFDHFRGCLLIRLERCKFYPQKNGDPIPMALSISFGKMPQEEFTRLVDDTLNFAEKIGFDRDELLAETKERSGVLAHPDDQGREIR